jgi:hypothetical protein
VIDCTIGPVQLNADMAGIINVFCDVIDLVDRDCQLQ